MTINSALDLATEPVAAYGPRFESFLQATYAAESAGVEVETAPVAAVDVVAGVAVIKVLGPLLPERVEAFDRWGIEYAAYDMIAAAVREADADPAVSAIELQFDSPGGTVAGFLDCAAVVRGAKTPTRAVVLGWCTSAAYGLAAQCGTIETRGPDAAVGSVGVVLTFFVSEHEVSVTSTAAPKKAPDPATEGGRADIRELLDQYHGLFAEAIAEGRGVTVAEVNDNYGAGAVYLAAKAQAAGMVDQVSATKGATAEAPQQEETETMDLKTLQAQHPEVYQAAVAAGVKQERTRVNAHIDAGRECQDMELAAQGIAGDKTAVEMNLQYTRALIHNDAAAAVEGASGEASGEGVPAAGPHVEASSDADVFAAVERQLGGSI